MSGATGRPAGRTVRAADALNLYDEYLTLVSSALLNAPVLSELRFNEYEQVILVP